MGYYTSYSLEIRDDEPADLARIYCFLKTHERLYYGLDLGDTPLDRYPPAQDVKWYDHEADMRSLSREFPAVLFCLEGKGEEQGDQWKLYCRGGKSKRLDAEISFPEFKDEMLSN